MAIKGPVHMRRASPAKRYRNSRPIFGWNANFFSFEKWYFY